MATLMKLLVEVTTGAKVLFSAEGSFDVLVKRILKVTADVFTLRFVDIQNVDGFKKMLLPFSSLPSSYGLKVKENEGTYELTFSGKLAKSLALVATYELFISSCVKGNWKHSEQLASGTKAIDLVKGHIDGTGVKMFTLRGCTNNLTFKMKVRSESNTDELTNLLLSAKREVITFKPADNAGKKTEGKGKATKPLSETSTSTDVPTTEVDHLAELKAEASA